MDNEAPDATLARCPICEQRLAFPQIDDYFACRSKLRAEGCPYGSCVSRDRALAKSVFSRFSRAELKTAAVHEAAPSSRGLTVWLRQNCPGYIQSGYFPTEPFGTMVGAFRNEDLEHQTFGDDIFDLVMHLDVLEHLFDPFAALREIARTLKHEGVCIFTAPTYEGRVRSEQVAFIEPDGKVRTIGKPEYHGNPQRPGEGALVTWRYGYDLPRLINQSTGLDVEVRRWESPNDAIAGFMTEVYILTKNG
jgi:SAM-dependent methyltransferase